ncbi:MAG: hypothetical protein JO298_04955 [Verrucomicrobia bacterium]|nr:hypothetical protein [Verrucomicrobiota bacterium]
MANQNLQPRHVLGQALAMEAETRRFYQDASHKLTSEDARQLLIELAEAEEDHQDLLVANTKEQKKSRALPREGFSG